jgi:glycolate oxidase FAD binding subunit
VTQAGRAVTALRLEGVAPSVAHRIRALESLLKSFGTLATLDEAVSRAFWRNVRDVMPFANDDRVLWRISTAPSRGHEVAAAIGEGEFFTDWAGGLIWAGGASDDGGAARIAVPSRRMDMRCSSARRPRCAAVAVFNPQELGLAALTRRVKESFDPKRYSDPGAWAGV